jgi:hypothetical protein
LAWCKVSSLTAAVVKSLKAVSFPASKEGLVGNTRGKDVEGWDVSFFLASSLSTGKRYQDMREVMADLESWLERQG